jgi:L-asparaginase II
MTAALATPWTLPSDHARSALLQGVERHHDDVEAMLLRAGDHDETLADGQRLPSRTECATDRTDREPNPARNRQSGGLMTQTYHVHVYREMRLTFSPIEADSPEQAAAIARHFSTDAALSIDDCDGATVAALVVRDGDERFEQSVVIEFDRGPSRHAAGATAA